MFYVYSNFTFCLLIIINHKKYLKLFIHSNNIDCNVFFNDLTAKSTFF